MVLNKEIVQVTASTITWNWKTYKKWFATRSFYLKWMLVVIISFPLFAATWEMKESAGLSPLQLLGVFVFGLGFFSILRKKSRAPSLIFTLYLFVFLLVVNSFLVFLYVGTFAQFGDTLRIILPFILFFYFRKYLKSLVDIEGFLITFLIASIFPIATLYYEILFDPIREVYNTESRGGGLRLSGFYADLFGYMSHLIGGFICYAYFFIKYINRKTKPFIFTKAGFIFVLLVTLIGIYNLRHQASWAVILVLLLILVYFLRKKISLFQLTSFIILFFGVGVYFYLEIFSVLYAKDINVYQGEAQETAALNGRVYLWKKYFAYWEDFSVFPQWFGSGFALQEESKIMMSGGMHNDYVRYFFSTGIVGIICYLSFLFSLLRNSLKIKPLEFRFLMLATVVVIIMYSISALPLLASGALMYFVIAITSQINKRKLV